MGWVTEHASTLSPASDVPRMDGIAFAAAVPDALFTSKAVAPIIRFSASRDSIIGIVGAGASAYVPAGQTVVFAITPGQQYAIDAG